jgi:transcriptional regulator of acetoin/glycerol metabolism
MGQQPLMTIGSPFPGTLRQAPSGDLAGSGRHLSGSMPKLRELREDVFFRAEYLYLHNLVSLTGRNIRKACELSGLSRSRLYTLLKKYQIAPPLSDRNRQK